MIEQASGSEQLSVVIPAQKPLRVLMVSSSGGHWKQLQRLRPAFESEDLYFACTDSNYRELVVGRPFYTVPEASLSGKIALVWQALVVLVLMLRVRPDVVVTTGAAPGFFALLFARKIISPIVRPWRGRTIKTIWVDSIANVDELSVSGRQAAGLADMHLTQWAHLADCISPGKPTFSGAVL